MMRSLYSGVAGLKTHQTKMDVIGNNIANVNTIGFKSSSVLFRDVLYQTTSAATGATATTGGTNAAQIGLGTKMSSIQTKMESGAAQSTNNPYDLMLDASSFFVVSRGGTNYFTKVGNFEVDGAGCLVSSNGYQVMGWQVDPTNPTQIKRDTVSALYPESAENKIASPEQTSQMHMLGNIDMTDPQLSEGGVPVSTSIYDSLGYSYTVKYLITQGADSSTYNMTISSLSSNDDPENKNILGTQYNASFDGAASIELKFDPVGGKLISPTDLSLLQIESVDTTQYAEVFKSKVNGTTVDGIQVDFSNLTMFESDGESSAKIVRGSTDKVGGGRAMGSLKNVNIDNSGKIYGVYSNGETKLLGQIAVANFVNPMALEALGNSMYQATQNSGEFDGIGVAVDDDGGKMTQGVLEMSNVDLSAEFTEMITTQRGFQANSRIITTSDTMLEELVNLKR